MRGVELTPEIPIAEVVALAERAEREGFDATLAACHYFNRDPFVALSRVAAATEEVAVGPAAANPYETHPVALASRMATLQEASGGRAVFGIGPGDRSTLAALGIERERPLRRVLEAFTAARALWEGEHVSREGTFEANDAALEYQVETPIPVYVGAQGPHMLRMAAKHADGVLVNAAHPGDFEWATARIEEGRAERVRGGDLDVVAYASVSVADDRARAREAARPPVAFIVGGASEETLSRHGIDAERAERIGALIGTGQLREAFGAVTDPMIDAFSVAGTPGEVSDRIDALASYADGVVAAAPLGPDPPTAIDLLARAFRASSRG